LKVSIARGIVSAVAFLPEQDVFVVKNIFKTCVRYFPCSFYPVAVYITWRYDHVDGTVAIYIAWRNDLLHSVHRSF